MYSQEEVDTADELSTGADDDAIQARVSEWLVSFDPMLKILWLWGEGKGYRKELLVGVYRLVLKILSLFQAKSCHVLWMAPASCLRT